MLKYFFFIIIISLLSQNLLAKIAYCNIQADSGYSLSGKANFYQVSESNTIIVNAEINGLAPNSTHGFHVHNFGNITGGCALAGAHYNPFNMTHGSPNDSTKHIGDMGNIHADSQGNAFLNYEEKNMTLFEQNYIIGKVCIVHELEDDLGKGGFNDSMTTGHSGKRIGCGIIYEDLSDSSSASNLKFIVPIVIVGLFVSAVFYYFVYRRNKLRYDRF